MPGRPQQPGIQAPSFLPAALRCPAAPWPWPSNPSPDDCSEGAVGKAGLKGHLVATKTLLSQPRDTSMAVCIINQFGACSLCAAVAGNALPQLHKKNLNYCIWPRKRCQIFVFEKKRKGKRKKGKASVVLGSLLKGSHHPIIPSVWNLYTKGKQNTWLLCLQEPHPSHQQRGTRLQHNSGQTHSQNTCPNPLETPSLSDQCGFLAQRFSLLPPALQKAQGPVWLPFLWCYIAILSPGRSL